MQENYCISYNNTPEHLYIYASELYCVQQFIQLVTLGVAAHLRVEILGMVLEQRCEKINKPQAKGVCEIPQTLNLHHPHLGEVMGVTKVKFGTGGAAAPGESLHSIEM
jgi:hypothetical protein